jgi:glutamyl-Q tRNA(Asp) synthetase
LHFGSLVAAVGSFLEARVRRGEWLVRIEDLDPPREKSGAAASILATLEHLGLQWDGPVLFQSTRGEAYAAALERLRDLDCVYVCPCSRAYLATLPENQARPAGEELFHRSGCRPLQAREGAWRFCAPDVDVEFIDRCQGPVRSNVARDTGDFVLRRRDGLYSYQLAVVVDDAEQGITDVVRGADLLSSTARQLLVHGALGLEPPAYMHLPLAVDDKGAKLSKSADAPAAATRAPAASLVDVLRFLRQEPPDGLRRASVAEVWDWALAHWEPQRFARTKAMQSEHS